MLIATKTYYTLWTIYSTKLNNLYAQKLQLLHHPPLTSRQCLTKSPCVLVGYLCGAVSGVVAVFDINGPVSLSSSSMNRRGF